MATAVGFATTVTAATVETAPIVVRAAAECLTAMECLSSAETVVRTAALEASKSVAIAETAPFKAAVTVKAAEATVKVTVAIKPAAMETMPRRPKADKELGMPVIVAVPRTNADKVAVHEIFRTPISVGCAGIRGVRVVSELAYRRRTVHITRGAKFNTN